MTCNCTTGGQKASISKNIEGNIASKGFMATMTDTRPTQVPHLIVSCLVTLAVVKCFHKRPSHAVPMFGDHFDIKRLNALFG